MGLNIEEQYRNNSVVFYQYYFSQVHLPELVLSYVAVPTTNSAREIPQIILAVTLALLLQYGLSSLHA